MSPTSDPIKLAHALTAKAEQLADKYAHRATAAALEPDDFEADDLAEQRAVGMEAMRARRWQLVVPSRFLAASIAGFADPDRPDFYQPTVAGDLQAWADDPRGRNLMLFGPVGVGKQAPVSEPVLTPTGWRTMGDLAPGDRVIGSDGLPVTVLDVYPQESREVLRVTFSDGASTRCGPDHLWTVSYWGKGPGPHPTRRATQLTRTLTTKELCARGLHVGGGQRKFAVPIVAPVVFDRGPTLPLDPYTLGVILGDAHVSRSGYVGLTTDESVIAVLAPDLPTTPHPSAGISLLNTNRWSAQLVALGLAGCRSWEKFVPPGYLLGTPAERAALLAGLVDSDGYPMDRGGVEFTSTSPMLCEAVVELTRSLGGEARMSDSRITSFTTQAGDKKAGRVSWRVRVKTPTQPFRLARKAERWVGPTKYPVARHIESIEPDQDEACVCIAVDAPDGLYVTRNYVLTHNTHAAVAAARVRFDAGAEVRFLPVVEMLDLLRPGGPERALYDLADVDVLVLDDLGAERATDWTAERLFALINRRWMEERPTVATSNLPATRRVAPEGYADATLDEALGARTFSRLVGSGAAIVKLAGTDRRRLRP